MDALSGYYGELGLIDQTLRRDPAVGTPCAAKFSEDGEWYRAVVESVNADGGVVVRFVDYGNMEVCQQYDVKELESYFLTAPVQCVTCVFYGLKVCAQSFKCLTCALEFTSTVFFLKLETKLVGNVASQKPA